MSTTIYGLAINAITITLTPGDETITVPTAIEVTGRRGSTAIRADYADGQTADYDDLPALCAAHTVDVVAVWDALAKADAFDATALAASEGPDFASSYPVELARVLGRESAAQCARGEEWDPEDYLPGDMDALRVATLVTGTELRVLAWDAYRGL